MNTPEPDSRPSGQHDTPTGPAPATPPASAEPAKPEPRPGRPPWPVGKPSRETSVPRLRAVILCSLLPLLPAAMMAEANYYWAGLLPVVFILIAVGYWAADDGPGAGRKQTITVAIVIAIPLALFAYLFVVCSNTVGIGAG